jgi:hypothetical protein
MSTATKDSIPPTLPQPKRTRMPELDPSILVPEVDGMPKPVREAAAKARAAYEVYEQASATRQKAEEEVKAAPALDERADAAALEAGEDMPERSEPAKRQTLGDANRREKAAAENVRAAVYAQSDAMREHYGEWVADVEQRIEARANAISKLVDKVRTEFGSLGVDRELLRALLYFNGNPDAWRFQVSRPGIEQRRREKAERNLALSSSVQRNPLLEDPHMLTEALLMLARLQGDDELRRLRAERAGSEA